MKKIICIVILCLLISLTGCTNQYFLDGGVVDHPNDLEIAYDKCDFVCVERLERNGVRTSKRTPMIEECTERQCFCKC